jgi:hypothetical protein
MSQPAALRGTGTAPAFIGRLVEMDLFASTLTVIIQSCMCVRRAWPRSGGTLDSGSARQPPKGRRAKLLEVP